jgi:DNA polymerase kappa
MLAKLEQEIPGLTLRLMGLRCTHLVSTKKPDARAFFGLRPQKHESAGSLEDGGVVVSESAGGEGKLPDEEVGSDHCPASGEASVITSPRQHGKEIVPNPPREQAPPPEEELWDCPVCARPQPADERRFNEHIDLCLSRRASRDTVQQDAAGHQQQQHENGTPEMRRVRERKRGRPPAPIDPRQKKLCFG